MEFPFDGEQTGLRGVTAGQGPIARHEEKAVSQTLLQSGCAVMSNFLDGIINRIIP
ncbi:hypothetical protein L873DRAFT_1235034 [Choiromyces venosus 120613-1]|uniref:Uncharacterized protein n=1 Tax=Choiromyces venosus 120613-1 TaxID=1336337 RepID=A0A3N4IRU7_9PEZI|nr:hypothetical protein L873DRAFT_1258938 [Choiromyces venosus 120613-1]RPA88455.1 hypothetical protein L873DRAFT_1235034 [Choiromyces venosus 120613-1]